MSTHYVDPYMTDDEYRAEVEEQLRRLMEDGVCTRCGFPDYQHKYSCECSNYVEMLAETIILRRKLDALTGLEKQEEPT